MKLSEIKIGVAVKKLTGGGSTGEYVKEPIYTVTEIFEHPDLVSYKAKGGKEWICHPSYLVSPDTPSGPVAVTR